MTQIVLASTSAIRRTLLESAGLKIIAASPLVDEEDLKRQLAPISPIGLARRLAEAKAASLAQRYPGDIIIGADQVLCKNGTVYNKPHSLTHAREQLLSLRAATHDLISAIACARNGVITWSYAGNARLKMRNFSEAFLASYLHTAGPAATHSVGSYQLEGLGVQLFEHIEGDYFTILGLPLLPLLDYLRQEQVIPA